jgi:chemotaxis protein methyltransferase CheR
MGRVLAQASSAMLDSAEFEFTENDFKFIQWFMHKHVGIYFSDKKKAMVYGRVSRQMRRLHLYRFTQYRRVIEKEPQERVLFINCLTTNKTQFFREYHHFEFLEKVLIGEWQQNGKRDIRIWSAGCSTGEEPYSFIASLYKAGAYECFDSVEFMATDLDTNVLEHAKQGIYAQEALPSIPQRYLNPCFVKGKGKQQGKIKMVSGLQKQVQFTQVNLLEQWDFTRKFDVISCRNVMIYFDKQTQAALINRFHQALNPNGVLFLGHSESIPPTMDFFHHLGHTIYVKK